MQTPLIALVFIFFVKYSLSLSEVDQECVNRRTNRESFNNDELLGKWYRIIHFNPAMNSSSEFCKRVTFTKANQDEISRYKAKYNSQTVPYNLDDNPVLVKDTSGLCDGMLVGYKRAKFFVMDPNIHAFLPEGYSAQVYIPLSDKFVLFYECSLRRIMIDLLSREKHPSENELKAVIAKVRDLKHMPQARFCALPKAPEYFEIEL